MTDVRILQMLLKRLERIPADSAWARRASGVRGTLLKALDRAQEGGDDTQQNQAGIETAFDILEAVGRERLRTNPLARRR